MAEGVAVYNIIVALSLTLLAGMCTALGGAISLLVGNSNKVLSISMAFAVGVMLYVSLADILPEAQYQLQTVAGGQWLCIALIIVGMAVIHLVEKIPHNVDNPSHNSGIGRTGMITALAIAVHNIPEGMATFLSATDSIEVALPVVVAIALHNIPEGIAVSAPIYSATNSRTTAMLYSVWCGLAEPIGAVIAWLILPMASSLTLGCAYSFVVGIMLYISVDMLLSVQHQNKTTTTVAVLIGMLVVAISLAVVGI